jgi:hypothetical protein
MYYTHFTACRKHSYSCSCACHERTSESNNIALTLNLSTRWSKWSSSRSDQFTPSKRAPVINWRGRWLASTASLDALDKRNLFPCQDWNHESLLSNPQLCVHTDCAIPANILQTLIINSYYTKYQQQTKLRLNKIPV